MKDLSIVIPVYNVENYLEECLDSIYKLNVNKEIILVNDGSTDNSFEIIKRYKKIYSSETIIVNQKNKGLSGARNSGLDIASGKYVAFVDSDDFILTPQYEKIFNEGLKEELDVVIASHTKYEKGKFLPTVQRNEKIETLGVCKGKFFFEQSIKMKSFKEEVWDDIYKKNFLKENNLKFKEGLLHEDVLFTIQALNLAKKVKYYNEQIYAYRQREGSIMSVSNSKNNEHRMYIINEILKFTNDKNFELKGIKKYLLGIIWKIFLNEKRTNIQILKKLIFYKEKIEIKDYIKIILILIFNDKRKEIRVTEFL